MRQRKIDSPSTDDAHLEASVLTQIAARDERIDELFRKQGEGANPLPRRRLPVLGLGKVESGEAARWRRF